MRVNPKHSVMYSLSQIHRKHKCGLKCADCRYSSCYSNRHVRAMVISNGSYPEGSHRFLLGSGSFDIPGSHHLTHVIFGYSPTVSGWWTTHWNASPYLLSVFRWVPTRPASKLVTIWRVAVLLWPYTPFSTWSHPLGCFWCGFGSGLSLLMQTWANDHFMASSNLFTWTFFTAHYSRQSMVTHLHLA